MYETLTDYIRSRVEADDESIRTILSFFKPLTPERNELLLTAGQTSQRTYFVGKGCLRIFFINEEGLEATRYLAFEGQFATALTSFITSEPSFELVQAVGKTELLSISHKDFYHLLDIVPSWEKFYRDYLEYAYVLNTTRLMSFLTMNATERYRQLLAQKPEVVRRLPNKLVASYLNMSQETLSRIKSRI